MTKVFIDYQQAVWAYYLKKKEGNSLSYGLAFLTPAKLKKDCEMRCKKGLNKRDEKVIRLFCGELDVSKSCETIIKRCDTDRFRPLVNFLKEGTNKPEEKNVELLALLLEFPGRPWDLWKDNPTLEEQADKPFLDEGVQSEEKGVLPEKKEEFPEHPVMSLLGPTKKAKLIPVKTLATITLALAMGAGAMLWWRDTPPSGSCMYWAQDHYEPIPCGQKIPGARIIALDSIRLKNFRRITRPDTISYQSKGKVWYSKISGKVEFYTWGGEHPVVFDYRLKPVTKYIIDTYILSQVITSE